MICPVTGIVKQFPPAHSPLSLFPSSPHPQRSLICVSIYISFQLMSISPDTYYTNITDWNVKTQSPPLDPNTLPATPPHTHLHDSQADMSTWDDTPAAAEDSWKSPSTAHDAAIAGELQAQELGDAFAGMDLDGEPRRDRPPPPRRPREYGTAFFLCFLVSLSRYSFHFPVFLS